MAEPTLEQVFGIGATRLASAEAAPGPGLFIPDTALSTAGLTPESATAEGHLVAIAINAKNTLTTASYESNLDQSIVIENGFPGITERGTMEYRNDPLIINLWKRSTGNIRNPNDY